MAGNNPLPSRAPVAGGGSMGGVFAAFVKLGLTAFDGPVADLGYFGGKLVLRRRWLDDADCADLVALCQFLPRPASNQPGFALRDTSAALIGLVALQRFIGGLPCLG